MQEASSFEPLFVNEEGQPYMFYIWNCAERKRVKELIEVRFGQVTKNPEGDHTIQLADPKSRIPGEVYSIYYITECCSLGKLLDLRKFRINPTSKYGAAFCPMDVLQGHITWEDAEVFSLEDEISSNKSTPEASSKRRKLSGTNTDEELEVIEHFNERNSRPRRVQPDNWSESSENVRPKKRRRSPFRLKEKEAIVQYLKDHKACRAIKGAAIWKSMEEDKVCGSRTWQSMRQHFLKHILPDAESYNFSTSEVALLKKITSHTRRKGGGDANEVFEDLDDDVIVAPSGGNRYTPKEDEAILRYISRDKRYLRVGGVKIWQKMERKCIVLGRTWQSLKERYRKHLAHRLNSFINADEFNRMEVWNKGSSRSKGCTCCMKSKSPASTPASGGDVSISSSSESLVHKRKLFTQRESPVQFKPISDCHPKTTVPEVSTLTDQNASCVNNIQSSSRDTVQHKTTVRSPNREENVVRKVVSREVTLGNKKMLPTVDNNMRFVGNKEKITPAVRTQNHKQQVNQPSSSCSTETSVVANCGMLRQKDSAASEASSVRQGQKFISSASSDARLGNSLRNTLQHKTTVNSLNCEGNATRKGVNSEVMLAKKKILPTVDSNIRFVGNKEQITPRVSTQNHKQQVDNSYSSSSAEASVVANYGTLGKKDFSAFSEVSSVRQGQKCISSASSDARLGNSLRNTLQHKTTVNSLNCEGNATRKRVNSEVMLAKQKNFPSVDENAQFVRNKEKITSTVWAQNHKRQVDNSYSSSSTETSVVANYSTLGNEDFSAFSEASSAREGQKCISSTSSYAASGNLLRNILQHKRTVYSSNCEENVARKVVSRERTLAKKSTPTVWMQNHKLQVDNSYSPSSTETSVLANCGTPGEKDISAISEASSADEGQKCISSTSYDAVLSNSSRKIVHHETSVYSPNREENVARKVVSRDVVLAKKKILPAVDQSIQFVGNKEKVWAQNHKQQLDHSYSSSPTEASIIANCGTIGEKYISAISESSSADEGQKCITSTSSDVRLNNSLRETVQYKTAVNAPNCEENAIRKVVRKEFVVAKKKTLSTTEKNLLFLKNKEKITPIVRMQNCKLQVNQSYLPSSSVVASCGTLGEKDISATSEASSADEGQKCVSSTSSDVRLNNSFRNTFNSNCEENVIGKVVSRAVAPPKKKITPTIRMQNDSQQVDHTSLPSSSETSVVALGGKDFSAVSEDLSAHGGQKCISITSSNAGLSTSLTNANKESSPECNQSADENENSIADSDSVIRSSQETLIINAHIKPTLTGYEMHNSDSENSFHENDPQSQHIADAPTQDKQPEVTANATDNISSTIGGSRRSDANCSPVENEPVLLPDYSLDTPQDDVSSVPEPSSVEMHLPASDEQHDVTSENQDACSLEPLSSTDAVRADGANTSSTSVQSGKRPKRKLYVHRDFPISLTPQTQHEYKPPAPQIVLLAKNFHFLCGELTNSKSGSFKRQKKTIRSKPVKNKSTILASKVNKIAKIPEKRSKLKKLQMTNLENGVENTCHLQSSETSSSVRNLNNNVAHKAHKNPFSRTSSDSFNSKYKRKPRKKNLNWSSLKGRNGKSSRQSTETGGTRVLRSYSKNSNVDYGETNQETNNMQEAETTSLSNRKGTSNKQHMETGGTRVLRSYSRNSNVDYIEPNPETNNMQEAETTSLSNRKGTSNKQHMETGGTQVLRSYSRNSNVDYIEPNPETNNMQEAETTSLSNRKGTSNKQHMETGGTQVLRSYSRNSNVDYIEPNQETNNMQEGETISLSSKDRSIMKTKHKKQSPLKDKMNIYQTNATEDMNGIPDDAGSDALHMKINETLTPPDCLKNTNYSTESNQMPSTSVQESEATLSNNQNVPSRKTKHIETNSFKDCSIDLTDIFRKIRDKSISQHTEKSLEGNNNMLDITESSNNLHKEDFTILDLEEIIPKEINCESTKSTQEIWSEPSETQTDPRETVHTLTFSSDESSSMPEKAAMHVFSIFQQNCNRNLFPSQVLENQKIATQISKCTEIDKDFSVSSYKKANINDRSCQVMHSPSQENASEKITCKAVQVCEISNSNVDVAHTEETNSCFNLKSNTSEFVSSPVHYSNSSFTADLVPLINEEHSPLFRGFPSQSIDNLEYVLCSASDNEAEHENVHQETLEHFENTVPEIPETPSSDSNQSFYHIPISNEMLLIFSDISHSNREEDNFSDNLDKSCNSGLSGSNHVNSVNALPNCDSSVQENMFEHEETVQSLTSESHLACDETSNEIGTKDTDNGVSNGNHHEEDREPVSPSKSEKAYLSYLSHLNSVEVESFNIMKTVDDIVNILYDSPNASPHPEPSTFASIIEKPNSGSTYFEGQEPFHGASDIKEEPYSGSNEIDTFRLYIDHDYCAREEEHEIKEESDDSLSY